MNDLALSLEWGKVELGGSAELDLFRTVISFSCCIASELVLLFSWTRGKGYEKS